MYEACTPEGCELEPVDCTWEYQDYGDCCYGEVTLVQTILTEE